MFDIGEINELLKQGLSVTGVSKKLEVPKTTLLRNLKKDGYVLKEKDGIKYYELSDLSVLQKVDSPKSIPDVWTLDDKVESINKRLRNITDNFCLVAYEMYQIYLSDEHKNAGYSNFTSFSKDKFGLGTSQTYNFIKLAEHCIDENHKLKDEYSDYNFSQLVEILALPESKREEVTPDMTVKQIRQVKKESKSNEQNKVDISTQIDGQQNFVDAEYSNVVESEAPKLSLKEERNKYRDENLQLKVANGKFEKLVSNLNTEVRSLRTLNSELQQTIKSKIDLSMSISILEKAWSNLQDDNEANELRKQIDYIMSLC